MATNGLSGGETAAGGAGTGTAGMTGSSKATAPSMGGSAAVSGSSGTSHSTGTIGSSASAGSSGSAASAMAGSSASAGTSGAAGSAGGAGTGAAASTDCDRACLLKMMQSYLDAVVAHDPTKIPLSPSLKMTDNGMPAKPGDGLWKTATMLVADERLDYADPTTKNVGTQCVINEGSSPAMYEVRLKVDAGQITEIETMTVRQDNAANGFFSPSKLKPEPVFLQMPDASQRMTRDQLMMTMEMYLDYLEGKRNGMQVPFDSGCKRYENGFETASGAAFNTQMWSFQVTRRILIIDEEAGIVWGMFPFMQTANPLVVGEAFKMMSNKIMMIQAIMAYIPVAEWQ
jgi:hypothetical protein